MTTPSIETPCRSCPFRKDTPIYIRGARMVNIIKNPDAKPDCWRTASEAKPSDPPVRSHACIGLQMMRENIAEEGKHSEVYDSFDALLNQCARQERTSRDRVIDEAFVTCHSGHLSLSDCVPCARCRKDCGSAHDFDGSRVGQDGLLYCLTCVPRARKKRKRGHGRPVKHAKAPRQKQERPKVDPSIAAALGLYHFDCAPSAFKPESGQAATRQGSSNESDLAELPDDPELVAGRWRLRTRTRQVLSGEFTALETPVGCFVARGVHNVLTMKRAVLRAFPEIVKPLLNHMSA